MYLGINHVHSLDSWTDKEKVVCHARSRSSGSLGVRVLATLRTCWEIVQAVWIPQVWGKASLFAPSDARAPTATRSTGTSPHRALPPPASSSPPNDTCCVHLLLPRPARLLHATLVPPMEHQAWISAKHHSESNVTKPGGHALGVADKRFGVIQLGPLVTLRRR